MAAPHKDNAGIHFYDILSISLCCPSQWKDQGTTRGPGPGRGTVNGLAIGTVLYPDRDSEDYRKGRHRERTLPYIYIYIYIYIYKTYVCILLIYTYTYIYIYIYINIHISADLLRASSV